MTECDEWEGGFSSNGYGSITIAGVGLNVHRLVMMQEFGHLERWQFVCHTCDNKRCINLDHLYVGTPAENMRDKSIRGRHENSMKTHCPRGHEYNSTNTKIIASGSRWCRECGRIRTRNYYAKKKEQAA